MSNRKLVEATFRVVEQMDLTPCNGCDFCSLRCAAGVQMSREEYEAVEKYAEVALSRSERQRIVSEKKRVSLGDGVMTQMCRYRDMEQNRCAVYPARPLVCRLLGHVEWMPCPIEKVPRRVRTDDALALMREYAKEERRTFEEWECEKELGR